MNNKTLSTLATTVLVFMSLAGSVAAEDHFGIELDDSAYIDKQVGSDSEVYGYSSDNAGIMAKSDSGAGVFAESNSYIGVYGSSVSDIGVYGWSGSDYGVYCWGDKCGGSKPWTSSSDERLKSNITDIANALQKTLLLRGVTYSWNTDSSGAREAGIIAQDVLKVLPEVVSVDQDGYYSVQTSQIVALLIEAIKEQQVIIEEQDSEISSLEERLTNLENILLE